MTQNSYAHINKTNVALKTSLALNIWLGFAVKMQVVGHMAQVFLVYLLCLSNEKASGTYENYTSLNKIYAESREAENDAKNMAKTIDMMVGMCQRLLEITKQEASSAHNELEKKKKWRKTVQKRTLFLATLAMKEDNSDLGILIFFYNWERYYKEYTFFL